MLGPVAQPSVPCGQRISSDVMISFADVNRSPEGIASCPRQDKSPGAIKQRGIISRATTIFTAPKDLLTAWYQRKKVQHYIYGHLRRFSPNELEDATENFSEKNIVGRGEFSKVYKGRLADGSLVAVKRLQEHVTEQKLWFRLYVDVSSMAVHPNILRLLGFCITPTESLLVYPFMINGSIASFLRDRSQSKPPLDWRTRKLIAMGSARGLAYLHDHCEPKIIHRDIQASNILLDENFEAVLSGFAFAKRLDHNDTGVETAV